MSTVIDNGLGDDLPKMPEKNTYNPGLRALLKIRNFSDVLEKHYAGLLQIEEDIRELNNKTTATVEAECSQEKGFQWKATLNEFNDSVLSINQVIDAFREKITIRDRSETSALWAAFDGKLAKLKSNYQDLLVVGAEILPQNEQTNWENDTRKYQSIFIPSLVSYSESCRVELKMIEKYTPDDLDKINRLILDKIPKDFTFAEAMEYEKDYFDALVDFKQEFEKEKNLWDTFLDILAGGTHQSPEEHVMMKRWVDGERGDLS